MSNPNQRTEAAEAAASGAAAGAAAGAHEVMSNFVQETQRSAENAAKDSASSSKGRQGVEELNKMGDGSVGAGKDGAVNSGKDSIQNGDKTADGLESVLGKLRIHDSQTVPSDKQGVINLQTGDKLVRVNGSEILIMPDGGTLQMNKDGSFDLNVKGGAKVSHNDKTGGTTITMPNGDTIDMRNGHIRDVSRGDQSAHMSTIWEEALTEPGRLIKDGAGKLPNVWDQGSIVPNHKDQPLPNNRDGASVPGHGDQSTQPNYKDLLKSFEK